MSSSRLDLRNRPSLFRALEATAFDLLVIGGGITGAGIVRDAALRGLSVALVEARDFASGTSSRSSKMIHGGLRYLAQGDIGLVREAASERAVLRRIAPHLAQICPFVMTTPNLGVTAKLRAALWSFEKLGEVPPDERHELWSRYELAEREPLVRTAGLQGAVVYPEFLTDDARLTLANVRSAQAAGAVVLNYATAVELRGREPTEVVCRSTLADESLEARIRAKVVVNAAGPWVDRLRQLEDPAAPAKLSLSRGVHLVFARERLPIARTIIMRAADKRGVFAVPRGEFTYVGTTDTFYDRDEYWPTIRREDVDYLFKAAELTLDTAPLEPRDIFSAWSGNRPLVAQPGKSASEVSRKDEVWTGPDGMISIAGGKLSAYRAMAERVVDQVAGRLDMSLRPCATGNEPLPGGEWTPGSAALAGLPEARRERLARLYGSEADEVAGGGGDVAAEAERAVVAEGAQRLEDYWARRSGRAWFDRNAGLDALKPAAERMAALLGWDAVRTASEIEACRCIDADTRAAFAPDLQDA